METSGSFLESRSRRLMIVTGRKGVKRGRWQERHQLQLRTPCGPPLVGLLVVRPAFRASKQRVGAGASTISTNWFLKF